MKVLQINSFFTVGGPPRIMNGIYDTLKENGYDCKIAAAREKMYVPEDSYQIGSALGVKINALKARLLDNEGFNANKATQDLIAYIKEYDPDIIHLHNLHGYFINIELLFAYLKEAKKPVVWTLHDCWTMTGHCPHFTCVKCDKWKTGCSQCPLKGEYPASVLLDNSMKNWIRKKQAFSGVPNMNIVCVSKWLQNIVKQSFLSQYDARVIYNGIDLAPFKPTESSFREKYGLKDKKVLVGVAMHWLARKGLEDYKKLAAYLDKDTRIVLVGLTPQQSDTMPKNIIGIPAINNDEELASIYTAADIGLNLSYEETFGLTSVEALACGTPIITYDQTAVPEISEMFGMPIVKAGDITRLAELIHETPRKTRLIECDVSCFEQGKKYMEYVELYRELIQRSN